MTQAKTKVRASYLDTQVKEYTEHRTAKGEVLHVFTPPSLLIKAIKPKRPEPPMPWVEMQGKLGVQRRPATQEDPEWEPYVRDAIKWQKEYHDLQDDVQLVLALRDYKYPEPLKFPDHIQELIEYNLLEVPEDPYQLKAMWLRATVLESQNDEVEVNYIIQLRTGVPQEVIDQMKRNFRDNLLGRFDRGMASKNDGRSVAEDNEEDTIDLGLEIS